MHTTDNEYAAPIDWKAPFFFILKMMLAFSVITFFMGYFVHHHPANWMLPGAVLLIAYFFCIAMGIRALIKRLPIPILMLLIPIAPLFVLLYIVSLAAFLQRFT